MIRWPKNSFHILVLFICVFTLACSKEDQQKYPVILSQTNSVSFTAIPGGIKENAIVNKFACKDEYCCLMIGKEWMQGRPEDTNAQFMCSSNCNVEWKLGPDYLICEKICEYNKHGLVKCRY